MLKPFFYIAIFLVPVVVFSQTGIGFSSGIAVDINNKARYTQLPLALEWVTGKSKKHKLIFRVNAALPLPNKNYDSAYTLNSGLPPSVAVQKNIKNTWFSFSMGSRFLLKTKSANNYCFIDFFPIGICQQKFTIVYKNYDNTNYEIINPDVDFNRASFISSLTIGYLRKNLLFQVYAQTPPLASMGRYEQSFKLNAPLMITVGYFFKYAKTK